MKHMTLVAAFAAIFLCLLLVIPPRTGKAQESSRPCGPEPSPDCQPSGPRVFQPPAAGGEPIGAVVRLHEPEHDGSQMPQWAVIAKDQSLTHLIQNSSALNLVDTESELRFVLAEEDDLGLTHVRFDQVKNGVKVFGGGLTSHLNQNGQPPTGWISDNVPGVSGRVYEEARYVDTVPTLNPGQAIAAAQAALGSTGTITQSPTAELLIFPHEIRLAGPEDWEGATLVYKVELFVEGDTASARWWYFVNAHDGSIFWHYDAMNQGTGQSTYSGYVSFPTGLGIGA